MHGVLAVLSLAACDRDDHLINWLREMIISIREMIISVLRLEAGPRRVCERVGGLDKAAGGYESVPRATVAKTRQRWPVQLFSQRGQIGRPPRAPRPACPDIAARGRQWLGIGAGRPVLPHAHCVWSRSGL